MNDDSIPSPRSDTTLERYIQLIGVYYITVAIIMTVLIGATYQTVIVALDRHSAQQEVSFLISRQFIRFQQLANQTRAVMRASSDPNMVEFIIEPMLNEIRAGIVDIRAIGLDLDEKYDHLERNAFERFNVDPLNKERFLELNRRLEEFLIRAETVTNTSHEERRRRYSFWGAIDFSVATDSLLMRQFKEVLEYTHDRSKSSVQKAVIVSSVLLLALAVTFLMVSILLFYPLLLKLRREHLRKMEFEQKLTLMAHTDALTALKNRSHYRDALNNLIQKLQREGSPFSLLVVDLDHFKLVNDSFGHLAGDAVLGHVANALLSVCRGEDVVARIGGDEFALLLPGVDNEDMLHAVACRVGQAIASCFTFEEKIIRTSASIGGAIAPLHAGDKSSLVRAADLALLVAKSGQSKVVIFNEQDLASRLKQNELMPALAEAAARDEFVVFYQPKICLTTNSHLGFEALVRWLHPRLGILPPAQFLPLMENSYLIYDMTRAVVRSVCRDICAWKAMGLAPGTVAVNLPEVLLVKEDGFEILGTALEEFGLSWHDVSVEVTEDVFLDRYSDLMQTSINRFREQGTSIALDDFGTGFASLLHLRDFPFDDLKIDRGFVAEIGHDNRSEQIVRTIVDLARNLGKKCVAEGIETEYQRDFLRALGCEIGQGYLFAKPMPFVDASRRLSGIVDSRPPVALERCSLSSSRTYRKH